ncbi:MAG: FtsX-like permease family protein [Gammaproteobacteria bacterium]
MIGNPLPIVWADVRRNRAGVIAVVVLIGIAVALGVAVSAQDRALRKGSARAADPFDLIIGAPGSETQLVLSAVYLQPASVGLVEGSVLKALSETDGVVYAAPIAFGDAYRGHPVVGTTAQFLDWRARHGGRGGDALIQGRIFQAMFEAVVGAEVALTLGSSFSPIHGQIELGSQGEQAQAEDGDGNGDALEEWEHRHGLFAYTVVGRMPPSGSPWDRAIIVPVESVWRVHALPSGHETGDVAAGAQAPDPGRIGPPWDGDTVPGVPAIVVKPEAVRDAYVLRSRYRSEDTMAVFPAEVLIRLYDLLGDARAVLASIAVATQALVIGAVLLAVFAALALRRRQRAVLRALGASRGYVFAVIWTHVALMIALGAGLGLALGWWGATLLSQAFTGETGIAMQVGITAKEVAMVLALLAIGLVLATVPGVMAYRQPVSTGLKA